MSELEFWKDLGNIFDAVLNYQKKNVEFNNRFINPWIRLGNIFERQDQTNDAVHAYQRAIEIDPDTAQNWVDLGDAQFKKGEYDGAIESYGKAVMLDPDAGWPVGNLALSMVTQGRIEEAIPLYQKSIELLTEIKDKAICWNRLGNAYRKLNDYENAFLAFQKADELDGENTGFNDKLDEAPPSASVVAPEEILEQMIEEQARENPKAAELEVLGESVQETTQPDAELETNTLTQVETIGGLIALAPNMEMVVNEDTVEVAALPINESGVEESVNEINAETEDDQEASPLVRHEKNLNILQVVKSVITKVELAYAQQEGSATDEVEAVEETPVETEILAASEGSVQEVETVAEISEEAHAEVETPLVIEEVALEVEAATKTDEEIAFEVTSPVAGSEATQEVEAVAEANAEPTPEVESPDVSARPVTTETVKAEEKTSVTEIEVQEELVQDESVTTLSEISQAAAASDLIVNMDVVETYTESLSVQLAAEPSLSEELIPEPADQFEGQNEAEVAEKAAVDESISVDQAAMTEESSIPAAEEQRLEPAYEEYLKDMAGPQNIIPDHVNGIQGETPVTKVSKNGEVRIAMDTKNAHVWNELGNIYLNASACEDAIASYSKAIELDQHFAWPYSNLALAYVKKGCFAEAILLYQRGIELFTSDKDKAITWNRLGNVYRRINDYSNAMAAYQTADELDPENATLSLRSSFGLLGNMSPDSKPAYAA